MMTIGNMIDNGTSWIWVVCRCGHKGQVDVAGLDRAIPIPMLKGRYRCPACGEKPTMTIPAWERRTDANRPPDGSVYFKG